MSADKTVGEEQQTGRRRRPLLAPQSPREEIDETEDELKNAASRSAKDGQLPAAASQDEEEDDGGNLATRTVGGVRDYLEGVRSELRKVIWPTREETQRLTSSCW